jgi:hypothetical protein
MTTQQHIDTDPRVGRIASMLEDRVDQLTQDIASALRTRVDFYKNTQVVTEDHLLASCAENLKIALKSFQDGAACDVSAAVATGSRRASAGVLLPAVMDAYRIASYRLWDAVVDIADAQHEVTRDILVRATREIWHFQNLCTDAMASAYRAEPAPGLGG